MKYRNIKTGAEIEVESEIKGNWEPVAAPKPVSVEAEKEAPVKKKGIKKK